MIGKKPVNRLVWFRPRPGACQFEALDNPTGGALGS
jgi:hypothetical protein